MSEPEDNRSKMERNWLLWGRLLNNRWKKGLPLDDLLNNDLPRLLELSSLVTDVLRSEQA